MPRGIRGIRQPITGGYIIGRKAGTGRGAPTQISFRDVARAMSQANPASTFTGQFISASTSRISGAVMLVSGVTQRVLNIVLPPGFWDLSASVTFNPNQATLSTFSAAIAAISLDPSILPDPPNDGGYVEIPTALALNKTTTLTTAVMRLQVTETSPVWLLAQATFS